MVTPKVIGGGTKRRARTGLVALPFLFMRGLSDGTYPDLGTVNKVDNVLTPVERDDTIRDLAKEQSSSRPR
jgi:hypothetical protein